MEMEEEHGGGASERWNRKVEPLGFSLEEAMRAEIDRLRSLELQSILKSLGVLSASSPSGRKPHVFLCCVYCLGSPRPFTLSHETSFASESPALLFRLCNRNLVTAPYRIDLFSHT